jgi:predicted enzyme related to lactoylglutathione lyase
MTRLQNITTDCGDPSALAAFWAQVLDLEVAEGANEFMAMLPGSPTWLFLKVPETKTAKNRVHVDLDCDDLPAERQRLESLGAAFVHEKNEYGVHWMTFRDPEGNEFCVAQHA